MCFALSGTTASSVLNWVLLHLALNPEVQQTLYEEAVGAGEVTAERIATKAVYPYLHAVIREQHRLTPALPMSVFKKNSRSEIDIHGVTFPQNTMFALDSMSLQRLPEHAPDPETFDPTRWLPDAVAARKGTPAQVIDHAVYRGPFSQGAVYASVDVSVFVCLCSCVHAYVDSTSVYVYMHVHLCVSLCGYDYERIL